MPLLSSNLVLLFLSFGLVFVGLLRLCREPIRLWPLRRDDHSGDMIGAGGTQRSDWPARMLVNDVIDSPRVKSNRLHACRDKWHLAATIACLW